MRVEGIVNFFSILVGAILIWDFKNPVILTIIGSIIVLFGIIGYILMWFDRKK